MASAKSRAIRRKRACRNPTVTPHPRPVYSHHRMSPTPFSRRRFLATSAAAALAAPRILTAKKSDTPLVIGAGEYKYEVQHYWPQLPDKYTWQTTHNVAMDRDGLLYVIHEGRENLPDHPSIFV